MRTMVVVVLLLRLAISSACDSGAQAISKDELRAMRREFAAKLDHDTGGKGAVRITGFADDVLEIDVVNCGIATLGVIVKSDNVTLNLKRLGFSALACPHGGFRVTAPWD
jgi:ABC-type Fe3+-citrate transport system substrate-binding protein